MFNVVPGVTLSTAVDRDPAMEGRTAAVAPPAPPDEETRIAAPFLMQEPPPPPPPPDSAPPYPAAPPPAPITRTLIVLIPVGTIQALSTVNVMLPVGLLKNCVRFEAITGFRRMRVASAIAMSFVLI
jgi:hypothetical protein